MLDCFEILTTSGVVLWSRSYAPVAASIVNGLINDVFIEEKVLYGASIADDVSAARNPAYKKEKYTLKWTTVKDLGLIFVVRKPLGSCPNPFLHLLTDNITVQAVYQSLLHISWIDKLLDNIQIIFVDLYQDQLKKPHTSLVECHFDEYFDQQIRELESSPGGVSTRQELEHTTDHITPPSSGTGSDEPPPIPGLLKGWSALSPCSSLGADFTSIYSSATSIEQQCYLYRRNAGTYTRHLSTNYTSRQPSPFRKGRPRRTCFSPSKKGGYVCNCVLRR